MISADKFEPVFTIRRTSEMENMSREELINLLPPIMQKEVNRVDRIFSTIETLSQKPILDPKTGLSVQGREISKEHLLLLFDPPIVRVEGLTEEENYLAYIASDSVLWSRVYLKLNPRIYQILLLRDPHTRRVLRLGRRCGKTTSMAIDMLWKCVNRPGAECMLVAPMLAHVDVTWKMLKELLSRNDDFKAMLQNKDIRLREQPYRLMTFPNDSLIKCFTSGVRSNAHADSVRGQEATDLYLDEVDYMNAEDYPAFSNIVRITEIGQIKTLTTASTPSGRRDMLYMFSAEFVKKDERWTEFYFPSHSDLTYTEQDDQEQKNILTHNQYLHEIMADFGEEASGVFLQSHIERAQAHIPRGYQYVPRDGIHKPINVLRAVGVDWDKHGAGTNIVVVDSDQTPRFSEEDCNIGRTRVIARFEVPRGEFTLYEGRMLIEQIYRTFDPDVIALDRGYGDTQVEDLKIDAKEDASLVGLPLILKPYAFQEAVEIIDPISRELVKKGLKDHMVSISVKLFEDDKIILNSRDAIEVPGTTDLIKQLESYLVVGYSIYGKPRYEAGNNQIGDHALDAFMLATLGLEQEFGIFTKRRKVILPRTIDKDVGEFVSSAVLDASKDREVQDLERGYGAIRRSNWARRGRSAKRRPARITRGNF